MSPRQVREGDRAVENRLPRAQVIAEGRNWHQMGYGFDTWRIPRRSRLDTVYTIEGTHPDSDPLSQTDGAFVQMVDKRSPVW